MHETPAPLTEAQIKEIVEETAKRVVHEVFLYLDVKAGDHDQLVELRDDLHYLRSQRRSADQAKEAVRKYLGRALAAVAGGGILWGMSVFKGGFLMWLQGVVK